MLNKQNGNVTLAALIGVVGVAAALSQFKTVQHATSEAYRGRLGHEMEAQAISSLSLYKALLSANGVNKFSIYPEPYLTSNPRLKQFAKQIAGSAKFTDTTQSVLVAQPSLRKLDEARLTQIMAGTTKTADTCVGQECAEHNIRILGYTRDPSNPLRLASADVEVATKVRDEKTGGSLQRKVLAQVPLDAPQVTSVVLKLSQVKSGTESLLASADKSNTTVAVPINLPDLTAELFVGGVAVAGEISILETNQTYSSDDPDQFGLTADGFPKHGAVSIQNQSTLLVKTPIFQVESSKTYTIVGRVTGLNNDQPSPELKLVLNVNLPPADTSNCSSQCQNKMIWYDGPFKGEPGSYATMIPGKYSCMRHEGCKGSACIGKPIYSFDPANDCAMEGPIGFRESAQGCFVASTEIRMGDGRLKKIQDIVPGDRVWNPLLQRAFRVAELRAGPETGALLRLHFGARSVLTVTPDHPFLDASGRVVQARDLRSVVNTQGLILKLRQETVHPEPDTNVYNIQIADEGLSDQAHLIEANGIVTGDLYLQNRLKKAPELTLFDKSSDLTLDATFFALQAPDPVAFIAPSEF